MDRYRYIIAVAYSKNGKNPATSRGEERETSLDLEGYLISRIANKDSVPYTKYIKFPFYLIEGGYGDKEYVFEVITKKALKKNEVSEIKKGILKKSFLGKIFRLEEIV